MWTKKKEGCVKYPILFCKGSEVLPNKRKGIMRRIKNKVRTEILKKNYYKRN